MPDLTGLKAVVLKVSDVERPQPKPNAPVVVSKEHFLGDDRVVDFVIPPATATGNRLPQWLGIVAAPVDTSIDADVNAILALGEDQVPRAFAAVTGTGFTTVLLPAPDKPYKEFLVALY